MLFRTESKNTASSIAVAKHNKENGMMESQHSEAFFCGWRLGGVPVRTCGSQSIERRMKSLKDFVRPAKEGGHHAILQPGPLSPSLSDQISENKQTPSHRKSSVILPIAPGYRQNSVRCLNFVVVFHGFFYKQCLAGGID